jgi:hypothetical protein
MVPFDCAPTVSLSEFRASYSGGAFIWLFAEAVEDTVGTEFIPFVVGTGLRVTKPWTVIIYASLSYIQLNFSLGGNLMRSASFLYRFDKLQT